MTRKEFIQKYCYEWTERGYEGKPILIEQMVADLDKLLSPPPTERTEKNTLSSEELSEQAIREFAERWGKVWDCNEGFIRDEEHENEIISDLTTIISEHYYPKEFVEWLLGNRYVYDEKEQKWITSIDNALKYWKENER